MITLHLSLATIVIILSILATIAVSLGIGLYCLLRAYRLGQFKVAVEESKREVRKATAEAVQAIVAATAANSEEVLELVERLQEVREGIRHLAPHDIQDALHRVAKLHAKDMTEKYLDQLKEMAARIEIYQLWLRALTGSPKDIDRAAMRGFPDHMPQDLIGRVEGEILKRRNVTITGRQQPPMFGSA